LSQPLIVLDTGVVVAALMGRSDASSHLVCRAVGTGLLRLAISDRFLTELVRTVRRKHEESLVRDAARAFEVALDIGFHGEPHNFEPRPWPSVQDPLDWWMPDLGYYAGADFLITWDHHLRNARLPIPLEVLTPPALMEKLGI
jgi:predicted nucleic acid-binding protein